MSLSNDMIGSILLQHMTPWFYRNFDSIDQLRVIVVVRAQTRLSSQLTSRLNLIFSISGAQNKPG